mmetsp:Transcript_17569/g.40965  ORF Transcript_17569/g.40965 Transcript_17569/m.40965 type:complete len:223 (-) Transcript_17569:1098-1766(-)
MGGNALVRDIDEGIVAAGNVALTVSDELPIGVFVLLSLLVEGSVDAGIFDSKASRDMAALPSAKASGVVPNFARAAAAASSARTVLSFCGTFTLRGVGSLLFHSVRGDPAIGDEKRVFTTADGDGRGSSLVSVTRLELQNSSFLPLDLQSGIFGFLSVTDWSRNWNVLALQAPHCSFPTPLINLWRRSKEEEEDGDCPFTEIEGAFFRPSSGEVILLGLGEM